MPWDPLEGVGAKKGVGEWWGGGGGGGGERKGGGKGGGWLLMGACRWR